MQTLVTTITAAALLWHTVVGCCAHAHEGACACGHGVAAQRAEPRAHDRADGHAEEDVCDHRHELPGTSADRDAARNVDHDSPHAPCRCHCEGNRCLAIAGGIARQPDAPDVALDILPSRALASGVDPNSPHAFGGGHGLVIALALPLRAHLFYRILLI